MSRLTKKEQEAHSKAMALVELFHSGTPLTRQQRDELVENYNEGATHLNAMAGAFFTPQGLANDFALHVPEGARVLDLCAGIGSLCYAIGIQDDRKLTRGAGSFVCVEQNPDYVRVGKAVLPEATWVCADVFDVGQYRDLGPFDFVISNPPFGRIKTGNVQSLGLQYTGGLFELQVVELAHSLSKEGAFILPQSSAPFMYSGRRSLEWVRDGHAARFTKETGITLHPNVGIDCSVFRMDWHGTSPLVEIVLIGQE